MSVIRVANESDLPRLMELYGQLHPDDPTLASGEDRAVFYRILSSDNLVQFVFEDDDGDVQATCYLNTIPNITALSKMLLRNKSCVEKASAK